MKRTFVDGKIISFLTKAILSLFIPYLFYTGCMKVEEEKTKITLEVSKSALNFTYSGSQDNFSVTSNDKWSVSGDASSWLTLSASSGENNGSVSVTTSANTSESQRTGTITVSSAIPGVSSRTVTVTQEGAVLSVSPSSLDFSSSVEQRAINITSNASWTVSRGTATWLTLSSSSGSNNSTITVTAAANTSTSSRTATIIISAGGMNRIVNVTQVGITPVLDVSPSSLNFSSSGEPRPFTITSNTSWTVSRGDASWLTLSTTASSGNATITVTTQANTSTSSRTATITISGGGILRTINVSQDGILAFLTVSRSTLSFSSASETATFVITSNMSWTVDKGSATWLTVSPSLGSGNATITVSATANTTTSSRMATITVSGGGINRTVSVTQNGAAGLAQIRFQKAVHYANVTQLGLGDGTGNRIAFYYFGQGAGISDYYTITPGIYYPYTYNANVSWQYELNSFGSRWSENLTAGRRYTLLLTSPNSYSYSLNLVNDGVIPSTSSTISPTSGGSQAVQVSPSLILSK